LYAIEIVKTAESKWYIHLHAIIDCVWIPQKFLSREWKKAIGDSYIVDIRRVYNKSKSVRELIKYTTKLWELSIEDKEYICDALLHRRFVNGFGDIEILDLQVGRRELLVCKKCGAVLSFVGSELNVNPWDMFNAISYDDSS
jgi:hypothetical protein